MEKQIAIHAILNDAPIQHWESQNLSLLYCARSKICEKSTDEKDKLRRARESDGSMQPLLFRLLVMLNDIVGKPDDWIQVLYPTINLSLDLRAREETKKCLFIWSGLGTAAD